MSAPEVIEVSLLDGRFNIGRTLLRGSEYFAARIDRWTGHPHIDATRRVFAEVVQIIGCSSHQPSSEIFAEVFRLCEMLTIKMEPRIFVCRAVGGFVEVSWKTQNEYPDLFKLETRIDAHILQALYYAASSTKFIWRTTDIRAFMKFLEHCRKHKIAYANYHAKTVELKIGESIKLDVGSQILWVKRDDEISYTSTSNEHLMYNPLVMLGPVTFSRVSGVAKGLFRNDKGTLKRAK